MKPFNIAKTRLLFIVKLIFLISAALFIMNSVLAILLVPLNLGSFLPGILGFVIVGFIIFIKPISSILRTKTGRLIGWACGVFIGLNIVFFLAYVTLTLIQGHVSPGFKPDAVIVLGAGLSGDRVTITLAARLDTAVTYCQQHPGVLVVVSGGQGPNETIPEAAAMAKYLAARGVPADKIVQESHSTNTEENFAFSKVILAGIFQDRPYKVVYITNQFHIFMAGLYAKKASLTAVGLAAPTLPHYLALNNYSREYFALIKYLLFRR